MNNKGKSFFSFTMILAATLLLTLSACDAERDPNYWAKTYDFTEGTQMSQSMKPTADGGYIIAGTVSINRFEEMDMGDIWAAKLSPEGQIEWQKTYSGSHVEIGIDGMDVVLSNDNGYLLSCRSNSFNEEFSPWLVKIDSSGNIQWEKTYSDGNYTTAKSTLSTPDGGYIMLLGASNSFINEESGNEESTTNEAQLMKLDNSGAVQWTKSYLFTDGTEFQDIESVTPAGDGGYIITGAVVPVEPGDTNKIYRDALIMRVDSSGSLIWKKEVSGYRVFNSFNAATAVSDGIIAAGSTSVPESIGNRDFFMAKFSFSGELIWQKKFDINNSEDDEFTSIDAFGSSFIAAGNTSGYDPSDIIAGTFSAEGTLQWMKAYDAERAKAGEVYQTATGYGIVGYNGLGLLISVKADGTIPYGEKRIRTITPSFKNTAFVLYDRAITEGTASRTVTSTSAVIKNLTLSVEDL